VPARQTVQTLYDFLSIEPTLNRLRTKLDKDAFSAVLDRWKPRGFDRDLRALHVALVLTMDVGRLCL
jgi:hypothetical protein